MSVYEKARELLSDRGRVPVFPLPDIVFFPHVSLPLHIFEPRYRKMIIDALATDRLIAMALLKPGWEESYGGSPEVYPIAGAGVIEGAVPLPDGRFNVRLRGIARVELVEFVQESPYRVARVRLLPDRFDRDGFDIEAEKHRLLTACAGLWQEMTGKPEAAMAVHSDIPFETAVNTLCQNLTMDVSKKLELLAMDDVRERCRSLVDLLGQRWREISARKNSGAAEADGKVH